MLMYCDVLSFVFELLTINTFDFAVSIIRFKLHSAFAIFPFLEFHDTHVVDPKLQQSHTCDDIYLSFN
jgi:hypothetical protein